MNMATNQQKRKVVQPPLKKSALDRLLENHGKKVVAIAALVTAIVVLKDYTKPLIDSHLPSASQDEVKAVADKHLVDGKAIVDQLDKLDMRQQQSTARGQNVANQLRTLRMQSLRTEIDRLKDAKDDASRILLSKDQQELSTLIQDQNSAPSPVASP